MNDINNKFLEIRGAISELETEQAILSAAQDGVKEAESRLKDAKLDLAYEIEACRQQCAFDSDEQQALSDEFLIHNFPEGF